MKYLLDTDICIYLIKQQPSRVIERLQTLEINDVGVSAVTVAELQYGAAKSAFSDRNTLALAGFLAPLEILDFTAASAAVYGRIRADLERSGTPIGAYDLLIAAQVLSGGLTLVTNNEREFRRIPGLVVENWV